uniref:Serine/threonine-protein kinase BSK1-like TPR repeats domain-containing protein n=1 Tax=Oryza barthii TaxID=65489 RepID=A0A0D3HWG4_9ORYZ
MASSPSAVVLQAALDGDLHLLCEMAKKLDLRGFKDMNGRNALHLAASYGHLEICKFLVEESGLDVNSGSHRGETPILLAACDGDINVLIYLLDHGGDPAIPNAGGFTPLHYAAEYGVHVDPLNYRGAPLHLAASKDRVQAMKVLLEHGADPNRVVNHIFSPLMMACCGHSLKCVKLLVEAGADVNGNSTNGPTPLTEAVDDSLTDVVKFLVGAGADPNIPDEEGRIPIMVAAARGQRELVEILFPRTKPIPCLPDWNVDGIIRTMRTTRIEPQSAIPVEEQVSDAKSKGKEAFAKGDYLTAIYFYTLAMDKSPLDATLFANRSLCWLRQREGDRALLDAQQCRMLRPGWSKAWYREGAALSFMKDYKGAVDAFGEALKLDPMSDEVKNVLRSYFHLGSARLVRQLKFEAKLTGQINVIKQSILIVSWTTATASQ